MRRRLPPLNALPSFEAAARHLSFSRAADELHVTHGAVSRAVRNLEDHLGVQLMIRASRSVRLTPIGASFAAEIRDVLEHLSLPKTHRPIESADWKISRNNVTSATGSPGPNF